MELYVGKTDSNIKYIDYITFGDPCNGGHTVSPLSSEWTENYLKQEIEIDGSEEEDVSNIPITALFGLHITDAQFCDQEGEEVFAEGEDVYKYIEHEIGFYDGNGHYYKYTDTEDGPIVADVTERNADDMLPEFLGQIVDIYEDWLDENGMTITNADRDEELAESVANGEYDTLEEAQEESGLAHIYGFDYDGIANMYRMRTGCWESELPPAMSRQNALKCIDDMMAEFTEIMADRGVYQASGEKVPENAIDREKLESKALETFERWGLCGIDPATYKPRELSTDDLEL